MRRNQRLKVFLYILVLCFSCFLTFGCGRGETPKGTPQVAKLLGGDTGGTYYVLASGIADLLRKYTGVAASAEATGGGLDNVRTIVSGTGDTGFAGIDNILAAYEGNGKYDFNTPNPSLRLVLRGYPMPFHVMVLEKSQIFEMKDLKGKRITTNPGAMTSVYAPTVLKYYGLEKEDYKLVPLGYTEGVDALLDGKVDAIVHLVGAPSSAFMDLTTRGDIRFIPLKDTPERQKLITENPYWTPYTFPKGIYSDVKEDTETIAVEIWLFSREDVSEDLIYNIVKVVDEHMDEFCQVHSLAKVFTANYLAEAVKKGLKVPLHSGAEKYLREKNLI